MTPNSSSDDEIAEKVFLSGISTAASLSSNSGRGVGLDAVRSFVREKGGDVRIQFTGQAQDGCRLFELVIELPAAAVVSDAYAERRTSINVGQSPRRFG